MAEYTNTYDAVISIANSLMAEGKYDSTYSAVLAIYQSLTADDTTKFDSTYSIVTSIANGLEDGSISIGGGDISLTALTESITKNGEYSYIAESGTAFRKVNINVDVPDPDSESLVTSINANGNYQYTPTSEYFNSVDITVNVPAEAPIPLTHKFYDLNGDIVAEWTLEETQSKTALPTSANIPMDGWTLNFDGWNWDLDKIKSATCSQNIGALYRPSDNKTHFVVNITEENLSTVLFVEIYGDVVIDWGDGTTDDADTITGFPRHTYSTTGVKHITIDGEWGTDYDDDNTYVSAPTYDVNNRYYYNQVTNIYIAIPLSKIRFNQLNNLQLITFPNEINPIVTTGSLNVSFTSLRSIKHLTIPRLIETSPYSYPYISYSTMKTISNPYYLSRFPNVVTCTYVESINIPDSITTINQTWTSCNSLWEISIPDSVTSITTSFININGPISTPMGVVKVHWNRFTELWDGHNLSNIYFDIYVNGLLLTGVDLTPTKWTAAGNRLHNKLGKLIINDSCSISSGTTLFKENQWAEEIDCSENTYMGNWKGSYYNPSYSMIKKMTFPANIGVSLTGSSGSLITYCPFIKEIIFPETLTMANWGAVNYNFGVETINFGNVDRITNSCCRGNTSLKNVIIPETVTSVGQYAFYGCESLSYIKLPKAVTTIDVYAFADTVSLTIDMSDFESVPTLSSSNALDSDSIILVPSALYDEWIAATNWASFSSQIIAV